MAHSNPKRIEKLLVLSALVGTSIAWLVLVILGVDSLATSFLLIPVAFLAILFLYLFTGWARWETTQTASEGHYHIGDLYPQMSAARD